MANDVTLKIGADTSEANKALSALKGAVAAVAAAFATKKVLDFFESGIEAAVAQEQAMSNLAQQLRSTGDFSTEALGKFEALAATLESATGISDDVILSQLSLAKTFGVTNEQAETLTKAAIELSAATGKGLDEATKQLGKTVSGLAGELGEAIPELRGMSQESLKAGAAFQLVLDRFGGSAEAKVQNFAGAIKLAGVEFVNFQESFGKIITENPQVLAALDVIKNIFIELRGVVEENADTISSFISNGIKALATSFAVILEPIGFVIRAFQGFDLVLQLATAGLLELALAAAKVSDLVGITEGATKSVENLQTKILESAAASAESYEQFNQDFKDFQGIVDSTIQKIFDADKAKVESAKDSVKQRGKLEMDVRGLTEKELEALNKSYDQFYRKVVEGALNAREKEQALYQDNLRELRRLQQDGLEDQERLTRLREAIEKTHQSNLTAIAVKEAEDRKKELKEILEETTFTGLIKLALAPGTEDDLRKLATTKIGTIAADLGGSVISAVSQGAKGFSSLVANLVKSIPVFGNLIAAAIELGTLSPEENRKAIEDFAKGIPQAIENFNTNLGNLPDILSNVAGPIIEKILGPLFGQFLANLIKSLREWPRLVGVIAKGVAAGLRASAGELATAVKKGVSDTKDEIGRLGLTISGAFKTLNLVFVVAFKDSVNRVIDGTRKLTSFITNILKGIAKFLSALGRSIGPAISSIRDTVKKIVDPILRMSSNLSVISNRISDGFVQIRDALVSLFKGVGDKFSELGDTIRQAIESLYSRLVVVFQNVISAIGNIGTSVAEKISAFFESLGSKLSDGFLQVRDAIGGLFTGIVDALGNLPTQIKQAFGDFATGIANAVKSAFEGFFKSFQDLANGAKSFFERFSGGGAISSGGGGGNPLQKLVPKFATGITEIPSGFPNDSFVARLSSGERVVDAGTNQDLKNFLANANGAGLGGGEAVALLRQIAANLGTPMPITVQVDKKVLGRTMLDLSRRNERTTA